MAIVFNDCDSCIENIYKNGLYLDIETRLRNELPHAQITTINAPGTFGCNHPE